MAAYVYLDITIHNQQLYQDYIQLSPQTVAKYDGKFIVRGGKTTTLEGDWQPGRIVILEFPSLEKANAWWNSQEYAKPKEMRQNAANANVIMVEGA